jgi:hypothetical protein
MVASSKNSICGLETEVLEIASYLIFHQTLVWTNESILDYIACFSFLHSEQRIEE